LSKEGYARYKAVYSDGAVQEVHLANPEVKSWPEESNNNFLANNGSFRRLLRLEAMNGIVLWQVEE
jgi:hypothetical protein